MSRLPIRARLTAAFALAMVLVLTGAGTFVYLRLKADLDETIDERLEARLAGTPNLDDAEESFVQVLTGEGEVIRTSGGARGPALGASELPDTPGETVRVERKVEGIEGTPRVFARGGTDRVTVVGQSLNDRNEALGGVVTSFGIGGPLAVVLASLVGYLLASAGLAPVEAMRRRAERVSLERAGERLPLPGANDEVRRLGETLNEMLDRLHSSFDRERRFVADASHELRTPLAVLKTELEAALRLGGHSPEVRESLGAAVEEVDQLAQLAEDLLLIARASDDGLPVSLETVRVHELLERAAQRFSDRAGAQGRDIAVHAPSELDAEIDPMRVRQALGNLVDNALRHGSGAVILVAQERDAAVVIQVSDEGEGFPSELAPRAFERFARGDAARTRGGAGLGLAIVKAIAEAHGGSVEIVPGERSTVRIVLPRRSQGNLRTPS